MRNIRAKMRCDSVVKESWGAETVKLSAVYADGTNAEDNTFASATPCASVVMTIDNPQAQGAFVEGQKYYVDFTPADPVAETEPAEPVPAAAQA